MYWFSGTYNDGGCGVMNNENSTENSNETSLKKRLNKASNKSLKMYPIKNLKTSMIKEGFRDGEFDENDKGTWYLYSKMSIQTSEDDNLLTKGMLLRINRNTRTSEGEYIIRTTEIIKV